MRYSPTGMLWMTSFLLVLVLSPFSGSAQTDLWKFLTDSGVEAYRQGDFPRAEKLLDQALAEAEAFGPAGPGNSRVAVSLENLAALHDDYGAQDKAAPFYRRVVASWEAVLGGRNAKFATKLNLAAVYFERQGRYDEAAELFARALGITEAHLGPDHGVVAGVLSKLAGVHRKAGRLSQAESLYLQAIAIRERAVGPKSPHMIRILQGYGKLLRAMARDEDAARIEARVAAIR